MFFLFVKRTDISSKNQEHNTFIFLFWLLYYVKIILKDKPILLNVNFRIKHGKSLYEGIDGSHASKHDVIATIGKPLFNELLGIKKQWYH